MIPTEDVEQQIFVQWLRLQGLPHFRVPNETYTKSWAQKNKNKALGVVAGVPDLFVVIPNVGLVAIEMKRIKNSTTSPAQKEWQRILNDLPGVEAYICKGAQAAIDVISGILHTTSPLPRSAVNEISPLDTLPF
jgi:hypothetical protein